MNTERGVCPHTFASMRAKLVWLRYSVLVPRPLCCDAVDVCIPIFIPEVLATATSCLRTVSGQRIDPVVSTFVTCEK